LCSANASTGADSWTPAPAAAHLEPLTLIGVPFQNNTNFNFGPRGGTRNAERGGLIIPAFRQQAEGIRDSIVSLRAEEKRSK